MTSFFAAFDALCEEGTATPVCIALNEIADISIPGKLFSAFALILIFTTSDACQLNFQKCCLLNNLCRIKGKNKDTKCS